MQCIVQFENGSVNVSMEKDEKSCEVELFSMSTQSSASSNSKSSNDNVSKESTRKLKTPKSSKKILRGTAKEPAVLQVLTRNEEALIGSWAKKHGKSVRQRNVRQDNTKDWAWTLPLNLYESKAILNPLNFQLVTTGIQPDIIESLDNEVRQEHTTEQPDPIDT